METNDLGIVTCFEEKVALNVQIFGTFIRNY